MLKKVTLSKLRRQTFLVYLLVICGISAYAQPEKKASELRFKLQNHADNDREKVDLMQDLAKQLLTKQNYTKTDLDSAALLKDKAFALSKTFRYGTGIGNNFLLSGLLLHRQGDSIQSVQWVARAIVYFRKQQLPQQEAKGYVALADLFSTEKDVPKKINYYKKAVPLFRKSKSLEDLGKTLEAIAYFYDELDNSDQTQQYLEQALSVYKSIGYKQQQGVYFLLAIVQKNLGNSEPALKYALMAESFALDANDQSMLLYHINNLIAGTCHYLNDNRRALVYYQKALEVAQMYKDAHYIPLASINLATLKTGNKKFNDAILALKSVERAYPLKDPYTAIRFYYVYLTSYVELKQFDKAAFYYKKMLEFLKTAPPDFPLRDLMYQSVIAYLQATGQAEKTYVLLEEFRRFSQKKNNFRMADVEKMYYLTDSTLGNFKSAIIHLKRNKVISDSIFSLENQKQLSALQIKFETLKKDKSIKQLEQRDRIHETQLKSNAVKVSVLIGSMIVLAIFSALLYNRSRLKHRSNKKLEIKQQEINNQNELLKKLVSEKEWLLKEIHHRVKNNLQIVISLLNTQSAYLENEDALLAIQNSQHRMHAMSLIHQKLYQSDNLASIDMSWYIHQLVAYLKDSFDSDSKITYKIETERVDLDVAQAVPLGLILNEAISNAIKYAFPDGKKGYINISLKNTKEGVFQMAISDNGIGLPEDFNPENSQSLGMSLMSGLSLQVDGDFHYENHNGLTITVTFAQSQQLQPTEKPTNQIA